MLQKRSAHKKRLQETVIFWHAVRYIFQTLYANKTTLFFFPTRGWQCEERFPFKTMSWGFSWVRRAGRIQAEQRPVVLVPSIRSARWASHQQYPWLGEAACRKVNSKFLFQTKWIWIRSRIHYNEAHIAQSGFHPFRCLKNNPNGFSPGQPCI